MSLMIQRCCSFTEINIYIKVTFLQPFEQFRIINICSCIGFRYLANVLVLVLFALGQLRPLVVSRLLKVVLLRLKAIQLHPFTVMVLLVYARNVLEKTLVDSGEAVVLGIVSAAMVRTTDTVCKN